MNSANIHIASTTSNKPVMTNHFEITVFGLDGMTNWADPDKKPITDSELSLKLANDTFTEPTLAQQTVQMQRGNLTLEWPGKMDANQSTSTFQIMVNKSAYDILYSWKQASGNQETGEVGDPGDYWKRVEIDVMTGGKGQLVGTWVLNNCWISQLQGITFDNKANAIKECTITLKFFRPYWRNNPNFTM